MPLQECALNLNHERRELMPHGTAEFPCAGYRDILEAGEEISWHWHEEIEVLVVEKGYLLLAAPDGHVRLDAGEGVFLNSNTLHMITAPKGCELHSLVFHKRLISGSGASVYEQKYVNPILTCCALSFLLLGHGEAWQEEAVGEIQSAFLAMAEEPDGYELFVRDHLSRLWFLIYTGKKQVLTLVEEGENTDTLRLKTMLNHIHASFSNPVTLGQIAAAAHIGDRECLRCFKRTIGISPMQYLQKHRILEAARLLEDTDGSVSAISSDCGFDSPSNFSRTFKKYYLMTPAQYRKKCKNSVESGRILVYDERGQSD